MHSRVYALWTQSEDLSVFLAFTRSGLRLEGPTPVVRTVERLNFSDLENTKVRQKSEIYTRHTGTLEKTLPRQDACCIWMQDGLHGLHHP